MSSRLRALGYLLVLVILLLQALVLILPLQREQLDTKFPQTIKDLSLMRISGRNPAWLTQKTSLRRSIKVSIFLGREFQRVAGNSEQSCSHRFSNYLC